MILLPLPPRHMPALSAHSSLLKRELRGVMESRRFRAVFTNGRIRPDSVFAGGTHLYVVGLWVGSQPRLQFVAALGIEPGPRGVPGECSAAEPVRRPQTWFDVQQSFVPVCDRLPSFVLISLSERGNMRTFLRFFSWWLILKVFVVFSE